MLYLQGDVLYGWRMTVCINYGYVFLSSHLEGGKSSLPIAWKENPDLCYNWTTLDLVIMDRNGDQRIETWVIVPVPESVAWQGEWDFHIGFKTIGFHSWYW